MDLYQEPTRDDELAKGRFTKVLPSAYEVFVEEQNIPIYGGLGMYDVRQLPLAPWKRMGGQGSFIELDGQAGLWGMYVVEVPAGGVLNAERHIYEETFLVFEGRGSTEIWREGSSKKKTFEWQPGSLFAVPLNVWHRLVNATSSPALVLVSTTAPDVMNFFPTRSFIFDNPFEFLDRYDESEDYFKPQDRIEAAEESRRATLPTNLIPDITHCYLPLSNERAPGHRRVDPRLAGNRFLGGFIAEYPSGRYSMAHYHDLRAILICLRGKGYTLTWPVELGKRPWEAGKGHLVKRQDYIPGGMVSAVPASSGLWFHQHFGIAKDVIRLRAMLHGGAPGQAGEERPNTAMTIDQGGRAIHYREEDPQIRKIYQEALAREGVEFTMPESVYR